MDRTREARRTTTVANGLPRRRHRSSSLRDSPEEDGAMELQEPARLRDRGNGKKDRDRERERDRERDRDRLGRSKRRRGDRLMHGREDGGEDTSEESINDDEEDDDDDGGSGSVRMLPLNPSSLSSSSLSNHHRKSFHQAKVFRPAQPTTWKAADEMIGVSVPRKARSASTKRSHECWASSGGIVAEPNHRQASTSPVRTTAVAAIGSPASPPSSNASIRKKIKPNNGPKFRPPKSSSKTTSSTPDEIEIEIAEVLYGMTRQPQGPSSKQEIMANDSTKYDSREASNKSLSDGKSRISSPISNSQSTPPQNPSSSATAMSAIAPKRKRPRPVKPEDENQTNFSVRSSPISSTTKAESGQPSKIETSSPNLDKNPGSGSENVGNSHNLANSLPVQALTEQQQPESIKPESKVTSDSKPLTEESEKQDVGLSKEVPQSPKKESPVRQVDSDRVDVKVTKANPTMSESENQREEKFPIDLMAPPPSSRCSPDGDVEINFEAGDPKPLTETEAKPVVERDEKSLRTGKEEALVEMEKVREAESQKPRKERGIDLQLDLEKADTSGNGNVNKKPHQNVQQRQLQQQQTSSEKNVQSNSVPLPISVPSWPGGLPPIGYMAPLQGVVSMDGTTVTPAAIPQPHLFNHPRPKRCATHCHIARNILYHQQLARMNPFWPAAAGSSSLYGAKPCNLNAVPSAELHGNMLGRAANPTQDKGGHGLAMFPAHIGKEKGSQPASMDNTPRKQILLQQALPPGAASSNILHGPTFIFPLNQQQAAASVRSGSVKSLPVTSTGPSSTTSNTAPVNASGTGAATAPAISFSYPNMPANETQYLAILQNNAYPFPIPAHVGAPPAYRGTHAQAFPFFNGPFYSSQMLHPSQVQQQQVPVQSQQGQQGHQNASISSGSSPSHKHTPNQNQQQKPNANGSSGGGSGGSLPGFPVSKNQLSQPLQLQQQQQQKQNHHTSHPARQVESEMGGEDSPPTADNRLPRGSTMSIYGQNFAMPMQMPNFALMTPAISGAVSNGSNSEKKQPQQHRGQKAGAETSQAFAMSFASINGATAATGLDLSSIAQNHSIMQSHHHNYQIMAAAQAATAAQHTKIYRPPEEGKAVVDYSNLDEDKKTISGKVPAAVGQSIAFSRSDMSDSSVTTLTGNINLSSASSCASASVMAAAINSTAASSQPQGQQNQPQIIQLPKQHQFAAAAAAAAVAEAAARIKTPTSNGCVYSDNLPSTSSAATKFPNAASAFPQNLVPSSIAVTQSPQWKNSARTTTSQSPPSVAATPSSVKTLTQQQARSQQAHTLISFAANPKSSTAQVQPPGSTLSPSPPVMVGSPTTSSMSKNTSSPRTTSTSTNNKVAQSSQQPKSSPAVPSRKSSPVGGRNVPSILSSPQLIPSSGTGSKSQLPQQQQKQQLSKQTLPQAQLFFSNPYVHPQASQTKSTSSTASAANSYYLQRRGGPEQMQRQGSSSTSSNGAVAANNTKGGGLPAQGLLHPAQFAAMPPSGNHHQFVPAGFPYVHPVPAAVQVKSAEQKQPAGE